MLGVPNMFLNNMHCITSFCIWCCWDEYVYDLMVQIWVIFLMYPNWLFIDYLICIKHINYFHKWYTWGYVTLGIKQMWYWQCDMYSLLSSLPCVLAGVMLDLKISISHVTLILFDEEIVTLKLKLTKKDNTYIRTLVHVATVTCWLHPTLNKFYLVLSCLVLSNKSKINQRNSDWLNHQQCDSWWLSSPWGAWSSTLGHQLYCLSRVCFVSRAEQGLSQWEQTLQI